MRIRRAADFSSYEWEHESRAKADFLADKFEEECRRRGVNPEHSRLEGYVIMDGKVPRLVIKSECIGGSLNDFQRFNRNQISEAVDVTLSFVEGLERQDRREERTAQLVDRFKDSFEVRRDAGAFSFLLHPKSGSKARMNVEVYCSFLEFQDGSVEHLEVPDVALTLKANLSPKDALALCEEALHNAKEVV